jgi:hypothetical protein
VASWSTWPYRPDDPPALVGDERPSRRRIANAISDTTPIPTALARLQGIALASAFQIIISYASRRTHEGRSQTEIAEELRPIAETVLDELDRWLSLFEHPEQR